MRRARVKTYSEVMKRLAALLLAACLIAGPARAQEVPPTDNDLRAGYCLASNQYEQKVIDADFCEKTLIAAPVQRNANQLTMQGSGFALTIRRRSGGCWTI
jgi:hypothetical protein